MAGQTHSKWECTACGYTYSAPLVGQKVAHVCRGTGKKELRNLRRAWQSRYDKIHYETKGD